MNPDASDIRPRARRVVLFGTDAGSLINFRGPLIQTMVERGHEVFAVAAHIGVETAAALTALGAVPRSVSISRTSLNPFGVGRAASGVKKLLRQIRPDVVIAYTIKPIILGAAAAKASQARFVPVVTGLGYAFTGGREPKRLLSRIAAAFLYRRAFQQSAIAIFQNEDDLADFRRIGLLPPSVPTAVINGSGVDLDRFSEVPLPPTTSFLMVARLLGDKGVREFGEATKQLKREFQDVQVTLVGYRDGSPDSISEDALSELVAAGIDYLGPLGDVRPAIAAHSVFVLPSYREGTPRSVLEAMAMGRAIITTDAPGCRETVVEGKNGLLVPPRDAEALLRAMLRLVREPQLVPAMGNVSRRIAKEKYDVRKVNDELLRYVDL